MIEPEAPFVRPYEDADIDGAIAVFLRSIREVAAKDYNHQQIEAWAQADRGKWKQRYPSRAAWVALDGKIITGFADLEPDGHLGMMFVHPVYQGRRIGTYLLATAESAARVQGLASLFTEASVTAQPFFERRGFEVIAQQYVSIRGQTLRNFRMRKVLS